MTSPTSRQLEVLAAIVAATEQFGFPPTFAELGERLAISKRGAHDHVLRLRELGLVGWRANCQRTLQLTAAGKQQLAKARAA